MISLHFPAIFLMIASALAQNAPAPQTAPQSPVSYASVNQINSLLARLQETTQATINDLSKLRIEKWKTDSNTKKQAQTGLQSLLRNLQDGMPTIVNEVRSAPEDTAATFKLYHNLDALHDVLGSVAEEAGAFGPRDEYQQLANDANNFDNLRSQLADRIQSLAANKEAEINRLRTALQAAQAAPPPPPKKIVIDDTEAEKPVKKKKKPKATTPATGASPSQPASTSPAPPQTPK
ncbi:MAG TPA: hypothetical protein VFI95_21630 [Terriglobales bacterium]|nr:hypothetical protein [Terriglobales bacterium]